MPFVTQQGGWVETSPTRKGKGEIQLTNGRFRGRSMSDPASRISIAWIDNGAMTGMSYSENAVPYFRIQVGGWSNEDWDWFLNLDKERNGHGCKYRMLGDDFVAYDKLLKPFVYPTWVLQEIYQKGLVPKDQEAEFLDALKNRQASEKAEEVVINKSKDQVDEAKEKAESQVVGEIDKMINPNKELASVGSSRKGKAKKKE